MTFLSSSLAAGALILLTALVRRFAGSRLPRRMYIALWDIAVLRLLISVGLPRTDGAFAAYVQTSAFVQPLQAETVTADMVDVQALSSTTETGFQLSETVRVALLVIWVAVALGLALYFIAAYIRSTRAFAQSLPGRRPAMRGVSASASDPPPRADPLEQPHCVAAFLRPAASGHPPAQGHESGRPAFRAGTRNDAHPRAGCVAQAAGARSALSALVQPGGIPSVPPRQSRHGAALRRARAVAVRHILQAGLCAHAAGDGGRAFRRADDELLPHDRY